MIIHRTATVQSLKVEDVPEDESSYVRVKAHQTRSPFGLGLHFLATSVEAPRPGQEINVTIEWDGPNA